MKIEIPLTLKQSELDRSIDNFDITGYGGAKGGGKSHGARAVILKRFLSLCGFRGALFRRTYPELEENHIGPLLTEHPELRPYYNSGKREIRIPALESEFKFRFCERQSDVDKYAGREYHTTGIEEAGDWPAEMAFRLIRNCNRSTVPGIKASAFLAFNWGGIGHSGLKRIFITKDLREHEKKLTFNFILAKVEDNPAILEHDPGYLDRLESEPNEALRRAYRHGDPDIVAGQFFEIHREVHVVKPFPILKHWNWIGGYDYGFNHPMAMGFFVVDGDGRVIMVHEVVKAGLGLTEQAQRAGDFIRERDIKDILFQSGHDCWAKKKAGSPTIAEDFLDENIVGKGNAIVLVRANIDRVLGAHRVRQYLQYDEKKKYGPNFVMFDTCKDTIECMTRMIHNPNRAEDVLKVDSVNGDTSTGDDPYDMVRMVLMSRPALSMAQQPKPRAGTPEWVQRQEEEAIERLEREYSRKKSDYPE